MNRKSITSLLLLKRRRTRTSRRTSIACMCCMDTWTHRGGGGGRENERTRELDTGSAGHVIHVPYCIVSRTREVTEYPTYHINGSDLGCMCAHARTHGFVYPEELQSSRFANDVSDRPEVFYARKNSDGRGGGGLLTINK